jgi:3-dehydroquinate synthase
MSRHDFQIPVTFHHRVVFTRNAFHPENRALATLLHEGGGRRALVVLEEAVATAWPNLTTEITDYFTRIPIACPVIQIMPGGEPIKTDDRSVRDVWKSIDAAHLDRHSYVLAIGGGAFLDAIGYAAATAHRGLRLIRFPTTTLAQDDSGVGVKCSINAFNKKNWIGTFAVPFAVINDFSFLHTQNEKTRRAGLIEAVKVALVKDRTFFEWIETHLDALAALDPSTLETCVEKSALLHVHHIAEGGDPFESGSSRPLDFGHWAAHKLEALSSYQLSHARAVAIGIALDTLYSTRSGMADASVTQRVFKILSTLQLDIYHPALDCRDPSGRRCVIDGLNEFREHLGGDLTVLMLRDIGLCTEIHHLDQSLLDTCIDELHSLSQSGT